ncbi:MAG: sulfatase [Planctomycetes bacterium]|nr:sulfatase [Planctomycetota bacterium]
MNRTVRRVLGCSAWLAASLVFLACSSDDDSKPTTTQGAAAGVKPSILFVSIDSLRADHVHCYGYPKETSPTLDALAAGGVRFQTAVSTTSWTLPAHAAMFTGLYDSAHGVIDNGLALSEEHVTLAEALKAAGYRTAGFFGGPYLHPIYGLSQGFDVYASCMTTIPADIDAMELRREVTKAVSPSHADVTSPRTLESITKWAAEPGDGPFFAFVHLWDVHYDYIPPPEYWKRFDPDYTGSLDPRDYMGNPAIRPDMDPRDLEHLLALYDGEILWTDEHLGKIVELLRQKAGGPENLLVLVTADHGEEFFEHAQRGHAISLFEEVVRVPLIVNWPGHVAPGRVVDELVRTIDIFPTLATAAGAEAPAYVQGRDLLGLLAHEGSIPTEPAMLELWMASFDFRALRTETIKALSSESQGDVGGFRLDKDPDESDPLQPTWPNMKKALERLHGLADESLELQRRIGEPGEAVVQPWLQDRLKQLGY